MLCSRSSKKDGSTGEFCCVAQNITHDSAMNFVLTPWNFFLPPTPISFTIYITKYKISYFKISILHTKT